MGIRAAVVAACLSCLGLLNTGNQQGSSSMVDLPVTRAEFDALTARVAAVERKFIPIGQKLVIRLCEDGYNGDAQFTLTVDGKLLDGPRSVTASRSSGVWQEFVYYGNWPSSATHQVTVAFVNDLYGGTPTTDRNLYVGTTTFDGKDYPSSAASLMSNGSVTFSVGAPSVVPAPSPGILPSKLLGVYWYRWGGPLVSDIMRDAPQYNLLYGAVAQSASSGTGSVSFQADNGGNSRFIADLAAWKASGRVALLTVGGGGDGGIALTNAVQVTQMVDSVSALVNTFGFQGVDWDLESGTWNPDSMVAASRQLKAKYGNSFIVGIVPRPYEMRSGGIYRSVATTLGSSLDMIGLQFYDYPESWDDTQQRTIIRNDITDFASVVPANKLLIGAEAAHAGLAWSPTSTYVSAYEEMNTKFNLRGAFVWDSPNEQAAGYPYAKLMGAAVRGL